MTARTAVGTLALVLLSNRADASHPLTTDDAGTQGRGKVQLELVGEYDRTSEDGSRAETYVGPTMPVLTVGLAPTVDLAAGVAYQRLSVEADGRRTTVSGMGDYALDLKWRFRSAGGFDFAVKPGVTLPTGDADKGLGTGKSTQHLLAISSWQRGAWSAHANAGWTRNANRAGDRESLWRFSAAAVREVGARSKVAVEAGTDSDPAPGSRRWPVYGLFGLVYALHEGLDLDFGVKRRLDGRSASFGFLAGATVRL